ncbi:MAG: hypothetical protein DWH98_07795 [Planctomycetota bacterium]|jgi:hypothetical protein|nr:hypothetical protein [Planctomycetia bacterium]RLS62189.1 MAG: hypothetical protein DWH98_07795 [Planctomycetota bacterium]
MSQVASQSNGAACRAPSRAVALALVVVAMASSGAACPQVLRGYQVGTMPLPRALPTQATLDQIIAAVHDNTQRVRSYMAPQAVLVVPGVPRLSAQVACEPPRRFRLRAQTSVTGSELDIGSNDDLFWLWIRRHQPPVMLFCRHDQYAQSSARRLLPIRADWMPELLGLVNFRPEDRHEGPFPLPDGRIEIRSRIHSGEGELFKSTLLDGTTGLVVEQHLFTTTGERLASCRTSRHRVDPQSGAALPRLVEVSWPASGIEFQLELAAITTNTPATDPGQLWQMPAYEGYEPIDLADPSVVIGPPQPR